MKMLDWSSMNNGECCESMSFHLKQKCDHHSDPFDCVDVAICYSEKNGEYGIIVHDGGESYLAINYCPWCGANLGDRSTTSG